MPPISELGPDALTEPMKVDEFANALRKKKTPIKALLLDQVICISIQVISDTLTFMIVFLAINTF